jgi:hypothetical protein
MITRTGLAPCPWLAAGDELDELDEVAALQAWCDHDIDDLAYDAADDLQLLAQLRHRAHHAEQIGA